jgi:hypothetical protein
VSDAPAAAGGPWRALHPREAPPVMGRTGVLWWIAGGWALDLFLGSASRAHRDLDVGILRRDAPRVFAALPGWQFFAAQGGTLSRCAAGTPGPLVNSLWARPAAESAWALELLLDDSADERWLFRRAPVIARPLRELVRHDAAGLPYLAPEIQLLYKANRPRPEDDADFARVAPRLERQARAWLRESLARVHPQHDWLAALRD